MLCPLFNNPAFPVTDDDTPSSLVALLSRVSTRAVALRVPYLTETAKALAPLIRAPRTEIAQKYIVQSGASDREAFAGQKAYYIDFTADDISREAEQAGLEIDETAIDLLTCRVNRVRQIFTDVYRQSSGDETSPIGGHILFTPKGGIGRTPKIHVDNIPLTGHWAFALAPLDIMLEEPDEQMWAALDRRKQDSLPVHERNQRDDWLSEIATFRQADFGYTTVGDFIIMKGQRERDLEKSEHRAQVCVHKSSNLIPDMGQATALFFPRIPRIA